jgi:hypothetical protein
VLQRSPSQLDISSRSIKSAKRIQKPIENRLSKSPIRNPHLQKSTSRRYIQKPNTGRNINRSTSQKSYKLVTRPEISKASQMSRSKSFVRSGIRSGNRSILSPHLSPRSTLDPMDKYSSLQTTKMASIEQSKVISRARVPPT